MKKNLFKPYLIVSAIMIGATFINVLFDMMGVHDSNLIMIYILAVVIIAISTEEYVYSIVSSIIVVFLFNFFFTEPRLTLSTYDNQYPLTFIIMLTISLIATTLTIRLKKQIELSSQILKDKQKVELLAHSEALKSNILKSISHDVRTPLTSISGCLETVIENEKLDNDTKTKLIKDAMEDANWMIRLIENILNITKIQEGRLSLNLQLEAVDDIISEAINRTKKIIKNRTLKAKLPDVLVTVNVDIQLISQVLINLIENAVNHTSLDGIIDISTTISNDKISIHVEDDGSGVNPLDKPHVFEMFYTSKNDGARGIGLGLSICRSIIEAHEGSISIADSKYKGAKFTFTLPIGGVHYE